ncbi:MAG: DUF1631 domain-containing protein [Pseudomonadales bacterium]|nr:DUF1631 domain-containing protein [Pseudomonadales bacterium]
MPMLLPVRHTMTSEEHRSPLPAAIADLMPGWVDAFLAGYDRLMDELLAHLRAQEEETEGHEALMDALTPQRAGLRRDLGDALMASWDVVAQTHAVQAPEWSADSMQLVDTADVEEEVRTRLLVQRLKGNMAARMAVWQDALLKVYKLRRWPDVPLPWDTESMVLTARQSLMSRLALSAKDRQRWLRVYVAVVLEALPGLLERSLSDLHQVGALPDEAESSSALRETGRSVLQLPEILDSVRQKTSDALGGLFEGMLQSVAGTFYERLRDADDAEQSRVMGQVQEIELKSAESLRMFMETYRSIFLGLVNPRRHGPGDGLELLDETAIQWRVETQSVVVRTRRLHSQSLQALTQRLAHVLKKQEVHERNMPLDPEQLIQALDHVISTWDMTWNDKLLMLGLFEKQVLTDCSVVIDAANEMLADAGVLPELPRRKIIKGASSAQARRPPTPPAPVSVSTGAGSGGGGGGSLSSEEVSLLRELMQGSGGVFQAVQVEGRRIGQSVEAVPLAPTHIPEGAEVTSVSTSQLLDMLSQLQQRMPTTALSQDASSPSVQEVRGALKAELKQTEEEVQTVRSADEDVINLVSMLFDFILDDDELPTPMKALLGRLQIPLLKVAMIDRHFFDPEDHPARALLNLLAKAGMGWSQTSEDSEVLYRRIEGAVFQILHEFTDDLSIFEDLLADFSQYYTVYSQRQDLLEKRTREAEEGKARSEVARAMVQQTLNRRLQGLQLPRVVLDILQQGWHQVLYVVCLREGVDSDGWRQAVKVVDALLWSVLPQSTTAWRDQLIVVKGRLINSLRRGLQSTAVEPPVLDSWLRQLDAVHADVMARTNITRVQVLAEDASPEVTPLSESSVRLQRVEVPQAAEVLGMDADQVSQVVDALPVGAWIERLDREPVDRCKLVARIRIVDKLIFTNRRGIKELELSTRQVVDRVKEGHWRLLDKQGQVFDRALDGILSALRQRRTERA